MLQDKVAKVRTNRVFFISVGAILAISYLSIALIFLLASPMNVSSVGYFLGSLYAHASLAAAWATLGPGKLKFRWPLSLAWVLTLPLAIAVSLSSRPPPFNLVAVLGSCLFGQWLLLQLLLCAVVWRFGLQLGHKSDVDTTGAGSGSQFRIWDLMGLMTLSACIVGVGRMILPLLSASGNEIINFVFLSLSAVFLNLPLLLAALVKTHAILAVLMSFMLLAVATYFESPILDSLGGSGPEFSHIVAINVFSSILIVVVAAVVRMHGFRLFVRKTNQPTKPV